MRAVIICLTMFGFVGAAGAADLDDSVLRGSEVFEPQAPTYSRWNGFYAGGQVGYATANMNFGNAAQSQLADITRDTELSNGLVSSMPVFSTPTQDTHGNSYGVFGGYNSQWEQVVVGVELNYNRTSLLGSEVGTLDRRFAPGNGYIYDTTVTAVASQHITDYGTLRARVGYVIDRFMPYATVGIAVGRADINRTASVTSIRELPNGARDGNTGPVLLQPSSESEVMTKFIYGYAAGLGLEAAILPNIFVRGEWEFIQFGPFSDMRANLNALRVGAGVRF
jgi:outer membrane immunogenic protein